MAQAQAQKPILISGAGLASLLLAQRLRRAGLPFQLFERDRDTSARGQGYRLRLSDHGLDAVESVLGGPDDPAWRRFWAACGKTGGAGLATVDAITGETRTANQQRQQQQQQQPSDAAPPVPAAEGLGSRGGKIVGIARGEMRRLFLEGCEEHVRWGHHVAGYELVPCGDGGGGWGGVRALFADGTASDEGAMLIGGEGLRSEVARQLSGGRLKVYDTGARGIHGQAPASAFRGLGEGVFRIVDDAAGVFAITNVRPAGEGEGEGEGDAQPRHDGPAAEERLLGWTMGGRPGVVSAPGDDLALVGAPAADAARRLTGAWHARVRPLFDDMVEAEAAFWKITCSTPTGVPEWPADPRVTVIGDAAHSMTPAGSLGANTALRDAALLGRLIADAGGFAEGVTAAYEREMRVYAGEAVRTSYGLAAAQFGIKIDESSPVV